MDNDGFAYSTIGISSKKIEILRITMEWSTGGRSLQDAEGDGRNLDGLLLTLVVDEEGRRDKIDASCRGQTLLYFTSADPRVGAADKQDSTPARPTCNLTCNYSANTRTEIFSASWPPICG